MTSEALNVPAGSATDTPPPAGTAEAVPLQPAPPGVWPKAVPLLVLAGLLAYANSFTKAFVFDDTAWITSNHDLAAGNVREYVAARGRAVPALSLFLNFRLGKLNPTGYHAFNLGVHVLAGLTLYGLVRRVLLLPRFAGRYDDAAPFLAFAVSLLWIVHPLQTGAVTYVIQRDESMMGLFYLFALYAWLRGATGGGWRGRLWLAAAVGSFFLSLRSKEVAATLPPVLLIFDRVFLARSWRELVRARWPAYLAVLAVWGYFLRPLVATAGSDQAARFGVGFGLKSATPLQYLFTQSEVILHYLRLSVLPVGQALDYRDWPIATSFGEVWPAFLAVAGLFLTGCVLLAVRPAAGFVVLWFFFILAPTSSVMPIIDPAFEHRMYLPLASVVVAVVFGGYVLVRRVVSGDRAPTVLAVAAGVAAVPLVVLTYFRNETYQTPLSAWTAAAATRPNNPRAWASLAVQHVQTGDWDQAKETLDRAEACPDAASLGFVIEKRVGWLLGVGRIEEAEALYRTLASAPYNPYSSPIVLRTFSRVLLARGKPGEAAAVLRGLTEQEPGLAENHFLLTAAELAAGNESAARAAATEAARLDPRVARAQAAGPREWAFIDESPIWAKYLRPLGLCEAEAACLIDGGRDPLLLDTLALWHARLARPDGIIGWLDWPVRAAHLAKAADAARRGVAAAEAKGDADWAALLKDRLASYEAGNPLAKVK